MTDMTEADRKAFEDKWKSAKPDAWNANYDAALAFWQAALTHAHEKQEPVKWPNRCDDSAVKALRYLADHERPSGGESRYNCAHLMQIASEIEAFSKRPLYTSPPCQPLREARMSDRPLNEFEMGYLCAVSNLIELHGADVEAIDTAREVGIKWSQIEAADLCEMDMINLRSIKGGENCPFGPGGGENE